MSPDSREARMMRDQHAEVGCPRSSELPAVEGSRTVEEHQRRCSRIAEREHDCVGAVDRQLELLEALRGVHTTATLRQRRRGMTSSANSVRFLTTFQCGMSPSARIQRDPGTAPPRPTSRSDPRPSSGVPATIRLIAVRSSQLALPCTSGPEMRLRNSGTVRYPGGIR